jgi:hypothetical protein
MDRQILSEVTVDDLEEGERERLKDAPAQPTDDAEEFYDEEITPALRALHFKAAEKGIRIFSLAQLDTKGTLSFTAAIPGDATEMPLHALISLVMAEGGHPSHTDMVHAAVGASRDGVLVEKLMDLMLEGQGVDPEGMTPMEKTHRLHALRKAAMQDPGDIN